MRDKPDCLPRKMAEVSDEGRASGFHLPCKAVSSVSNNTLVSRFGY